MNVETSDIEDDELDFEPLTVGRLKKNLKKFPNAMPILTMCAGKTHHLRGVYVSCDKGENGKFINC